MSDESSKAILAVPTAEKSQFKRNFIQQAVCELRFPTLFELESERPPVDFARALRKDYPAHSLTQEVSVAETAMGKPHMQHLFKSQDGKWTITLKASSISIETTKYESFDQLEQRLDQLLKVSKSLIDSDFFTRIGLRYINALPWNRAEISQWINPLLVGPLLADELGSIHDIRQYIRGNTATGGFLMQHGVGMVAGRQERSYIFDYDLFQENVEFDAAAKVVDALHLQEFSLFMWCLGPKAKDHLGPSILKKAKKTS